MFYNVSSGDCSEQIEATSLKEAAEKFFYSNKENIAEIIIVKEDKKKLPSSQYFLSADFFKTLPKFRLVS